MTVALGLVGEAEAQVRQRVQDDIPADRVAGEGTLGGGDGLVIGAHEIEMERQRDRDLAQPPRVVEGRCEGLGLVQGRQDTLKSAERTERRAQRGPEIDGLLTRLARLRPMQDAERLLEIRHGLDRPTAPWPSPPAGRTCQGFVPYPAPQGMVGQAFDLLSQAIPSERLQGLDNPGMQRRRRSWSSVS